MHATMRVRCTCNASMTNVLVQQGDSGSSQRAHMHSHTAKQSRKKISKNFAQHVCLRVSNHATEVVHVTARVVAHSCMTSTTRLRTCISRRRNSTLHVNDAMHRDASR